jgi:hypothetical protein
MGNETHLSTAKTSIFSANKVYLPEERCRAFIEEEGDVFLLYAVHYPKPEKEERLIQSMRQFGELIQKQPGIIFVNPTPFRDLEKETLITLAIWESQEAFQASWPILVKDAPSEEWEVEPREVHMFNTVV